MDGEYVDLPQGLVKAEPRASGQVSQVVVDRHVILGCVGDGTVNYDAVAVNVDVGQPPALAARVVAGLEAAKAGVQEERFDDVVLCQVSIGTPLEPHRAEDHLVHPLRR